MDDWGNWRLNYSNERNIEVRQAETRDMKGWLLIQTYAEYREATHQSHASSPESFILLNHQSSTTAKGAFPISHSIKVQDFLKVYAEHDGTKVDAKFNIVNNVQDGDNGTYQIKGGRFSGAGTFVNIAPKEESDFKMFFLCHSNSPSGLYLRWEVGISELVEAESI